MSQKVKVRLSGARIRKHKRPQDVSGAFSAGALTERLRGAGPYSSSVQPDQCKAEPGVSLCLVPSDQCKEPSLIYTELEMF